MYPKQAIILYFDSDSTTRISETIHHVNDVCGGKLWVGWRPGVDLFSQMEEEDLPGMEQVLKKFADETRPLQLNLAYVGLSHEKLGCVKLIGVTTSDLLALRRKLNQCFLDAGYYAEPLDWPEIWSANCSIVSFLSSEMQLRAADICRKSDLMGLVDIISIGMVGYYPETEKAVRTICEFPLGK